MNETKSLKIYLVRDLTFDVSLAAPDVRGSRRKRPEPADCFAETRLVSSLLHHSFDGMFFDTCVQTNFNGHCVQSK